MYLTKRIKNKYDPTVYASITGQEFARIFTEALHNCESYYGNSLWTHFRFSDTSEIRVSSNEICITDSRNNWMAYMYLE